VNFYVYELPKVEEAYDTVNEFFGSEAVDKKQALAAASMNFFMSLAISSLLNIYFIVVFYSFWKNPKGSKT
jgi:hypothetical protein